MDEFLQIDFGPELRAELDNGIIRVLAGATREHSMVQTNIIGFLAARLRGSGHRVYGSSIGVRTVERSFRYPDATVDRGSVNDRPTDLMLPALDVTIPYDEIFATD